MYSFFLKEGAVDIRIKDHYAGHRPLIAEDWPNFDRIVMTEREAVSLAETVCDSNYLSSRYLLQPSIPEFTAIIDCEGQTESTYVCFQKTLMDEEDFELHCRPGLSVRLTPAIDAYVYINNRGTLCNCVVTLCRCRLENGGHGVTSTVQLITWRHDDPYTQVLFEDTVYTDEFLRTVKMIYLGVQMLSLERPELMTPETVVAEQPPSARHGNRRQRQHRVRFVKRYRVSEDIVRSVAERVRHRITCPCWGVAGHWRTCKSGKRTWVRPYRKGRQRNNPAAYVPKEYALPKEETD